LIIAVVGLPGSGKSTASQILKKHGFRIIEMGDMVRAQMKKHKVVINHLNLRNWSHDARVKHGKDIVAKWAHAIIKKSRGDIAIMGMRSTYELHYFKKHLKHFELIAITAPAKLRFGRLHKRAKPEDPKTFKEFLWLEKREQQGFMKSKSGAKTGILHLIKDADYIISNTGSPAKQDKDMMVVICDIKKRSANK
jgi:dephospho-CoA kinase